MHAPSASLAIAASSAPASWPPRLIGIWPIRSRTQPAGRDFHSECFANACTCRRRRAAARVIHCDVMDGHFVPPITLGPLIVGSLADQVHGAGGMLDVHLMIERPERHVAEFVKAGADMISVHWEATPHVHYTLQAIRDAGCMASLALNPATPTEAVGELIADVDNLLCMTVNPGWGGQPFI